MSVDSRSISPPNLMKVNKRSLLEVLQESKTIQSSIMLSKYNHNYESRVHLE